MRKIATIVSVLIVTMCVAISCSSNKPGRRAVEFNKLINKNKLTEAVALVHIEAADSVEAASKRAEALKIIEEMIASRYEQKGGVRRFKIVKESYLTDNSYYVEVSLKYRDRSIEKSRDTYVLGADGIWRATLENFY